MKQGIETVFSISPTQFYLPIVTQRDTTNTINRLNNEGKNVKNVTVSEMQARAMGNWSNTITIVWEADENDPKFQAWETAEEQRKKEKEEGGCYVATAVYGSYDCPQVWVLRRYRDEILAKNWCGRLFIYIYYAVSPIIVKYWGHTKWFTRFWKAKLDKKVHNLQEYGVLDTPYSDRKWNK